MAQWDFGGRRSEFGFLPDCHAIWKYECRALGLLQPLSPSRVLHPSAFTDGRSNAPDYVRYPYVSSLAESGDCALLAVMTSDARVEIHQPTRSCTPLPVATSGPTGLQTSPHPPTDSLRLSINPADTRARAADLCWLPDRDSVVLGMSDRPALWTFDIETCRETRPCREQRLFRGGQEEGHGVTDMTTMPGLGCVIAACRDRRVYLSDFRQGKLFSTFPVSAGNCVVASADPLVFVCGDGFIRAYDIRSLPSSSPKVSLVSMAPRQKPLKELRVSHSTDFCFAQPVMNGARVAFQDLAGLVGLANFVSGDIEKSPEAVRDEPKEVIPGSGLYELGTMERHRRENPWYIARRRGVVVPGPVREGGWRIVAPCVGRSAIRIVPLGLPRSVPVPLAGPKSGPKSVGNFRPFCSRRTLRRNALRGQKEKVLETKDHVACVMADEGLQRLVLGLNGNAVDIYRMETQMTASQP